MIVLVDGRVAATSPALGRLMVRIPPPRARAAGLTTVNVAVNNGRGAYPWIEASYSAAAAPPFALIDGNYRYTTAPPNRWTDSGSVESRGELMN